MKTRAGKKAARANETPEERVKRLEAKSWRAARRAAETYEEWESNIMEAQKRHANNKRSKERYAKIKEMERKRLEAMRLSIARQANETVEERKNRLLAERRRLEAEIAEQKEKSLLINRQRAIARRAARKKAESMKADCENPKDIPSTSNENIKYVYQTSKKEERNFVLNIYTKSVPALNYSGSSSNYSRCTTFKSEPTSIPSTSTNNNSTVKQNTVKISAYIITNANVKNCPSVKTVPVPQQIFYNCNKVQQNVDEDVSPLYPICKIEESTEIITPD